MELLTYQLQTLREKCQRLEPMEDELEDLKLQNKVYNSIHVHVHVHVYMMMEM